MTARPLFCAPLTLVAFCLAGAVGCTGSIGTNDTDPPADPGQPSGGSRSGGTTAGMAEPPSRSDPGTGVAASGSCPNSQRRGLANNSMRRLTRPQLVNTLKDLLGSSIMGDQSIQTALNAIGTDTITTGPSDIQRDPSEQLAGALFTVATRAADLAPTSNVGVFGSCAKQNPVTDQCATAFIQSFGLRVYRRPLSSAEVTALMATYTRAGGAMPGLQALLGRLLQSPSMVFFIESGGAPSGGRVRLSDYEIASRLSYLLTDTMPDPALFAAAASGDLGKIETVKAHVQRLLATPGARAKMNAFFGFYTQADLLPVPRASAATVAGIDTKNLATEMRQELFDYINYQVSTRNGSFKDLMTSEAAFPRSANMAKLLETTLPSGAEPAHTNSAHAGLLLRPALLASDAPRTPAMHRGHVVRSQILCDALPPPPPEAAAAIAASANSMKTMGNRLYLEQVTSSGGPACMSCHRLINPLAFALEGYDQVGATRSIETTYDTKDSPAQKFPINTIVQNPQIEDGGPVGLGGGVDLVSAVAASNKARACFAATVFQYYRWRDLSDDDACALADIYAATADSANLAQLFVVNVANEDILWKAN